MLDGRGGRSVKLYLADGTAHGRVSGRDRQLVRQNAGGAATARKTPSGTFPAGYKVLRDRLLADRQLVEQGPDFYRFASDMTFSSPSAAASIVAARSASGPLEWKLSSGQTYRDWQANKLEQ